MWAASFTPRGKSPWYSSDRRLPKDCILISCVPCVLHAPPISPPLTSSPLIIFDVSYKLWSFSLRSLLQSPTTSSPLDQNFLPSTLFSNTPNVFSSLIVRDQISTHLVVCLWILSWQIIFFCLPAFLSMAIMSLFHPKHLRSSSCAAVCLSSRVVTSLLGNNFISNRMSPSECHQPALW